ncbi:long-chain-fatty-acid--CoA ligase ACSBG1 [Gastrophryne carolinensis]
MELPIVEPTLEIPSIKSTEKLWTTSADGSVVLRIDPSCPQPPVTVHQMFLECVDKYGTLNAISSKRDGVWEHMTFVEYYKLCRRAAKSFLKLGLKRFYSVGILGFNSPEWFISAVGTVFAGGIMTGIYTTNSPEACHYVASDCRANIIVVENQKQLEKILQIWEKLPHLKAVVQYKGSLQVKRPDLYTWDEFLELGKDISEEHLDDIINSQKPNQCCVLIYTSGTTGTPKGVMLSHDNITWTAAQASRVGDMQPAEIQQETIVSYLPLSHIAGQIYDLWTGIKWGEHVYFANPDALKGTLVDTLREVQPSSHMGVPRVWEKIMERIKEVSSQATVIKKKMLSWAMAVNLQNNTSPHRNGERKQFLPAMADYLVLSKIRKILGFSHCLKHFSGAAPISKETLEFFLGLNIVLYEAYGMSETSGPHVMSGPYNHRFQCCGKAVPGCQVKIVNKDTNGNGEICFWGRTVFMGYLNMEEKTKEVFDDDGWLCSGDIGQLDADGYLQVTGRIKELIITAGGENIPPIPIEDAVKRQIAIVSKAVLIGDRQKFLSMLLTLKSEVESDSLEPTDHLTHEAIQFCQEVGSKATTVSQIVKQKDQAVYKRIQAGIDKVNNEAVSNAQRIQKWAILEKDFSISGGEMGPTMKLKRHAILEKYSDVVETFYSGLQ